MPSFLYSSSFSFLAFHIFRSFTFSFLASFTYLAFLSSLPLPISFSFPCFLYLSSSPSLASFTYLPFLSSLSVSSLPVLLFLSLPYLSFHIFPSFAYFPFLTSLSIPSLPYLYFPAFLSLPTYLSSSLTCPSVRFLLVHSFVSRFHAARHHSVLLAFVIFISCLL